MLRVMVVGGGAREHTITWKLRQSNKISELFCVPGNAGTQTIARNLDIFVSNLDSICDAAKKNKIDLVVIGPEIPLADGLVDMLHNLGIAAFGPDKKAAQIESSKVFAKKIMHKYKIPCAKDAVFNSFEKASDYVKSQKAPLVVKADGLAAGKGVIIATSNDEALKALSDIMVNRAFGNSGNQVIIEECLVGREASMLAFTDGKTVVPIIPARDYKRALDGDKGLNTGGMGVYSPLTFITDDLRKSIVKTILQPTVKAMASEGIPYKGMLYAGLMLTNEGPKVLEFNARFGDPETQAQLPLLKSDLVDIMLATIEGTLNKVKFEWSDDSCVGVVLAAQGYPGSHKIGLSITGLNDVDSNVLIFHAGTASENGTIYTAGGRVLTVVATDTTISKARERVYANIPRIRFDNCYYRKDIAAEEA